MKQSWQPQHELMTLAYSPGRHFSHWLKLDFATLIENIRNYSSKSEYLDLCVPFYRAIWPYIEEELIRSGIKGLLSIDPKILLKASDSFRKIILPGSFPGAQGYAMEGLIPVSGSFAECLSLSNLAQMHDCRFEFILRLRGSAIESIQSDDIIAGICERLQTLPMIELSGFFSHYPARSDEISAIRSTFTSAALEKTTFLTLATEENDDVHNNAKYINWQALALGADNRGVFPCEIGFWATPVKTGKDYQLFIIDMGLAHGLCESFPAKIGEFDARVIEVFERHCEMIIHGNHQGPYPVKGFLSGGPAHCCVALEAWSRINLKNLLIHLDGCPVYLEKDGRIIEILPALNG